MARLCATIGQRLGRDGAIGKRVLDWPGRPDASADALPLRLCGGLHALVRSGDLPALASLYPPHPMPDEDRLWEAVAGALIEAEAALLPWLDLPPQTNEVGRAAVLMSGLLVAAAAFEAPIRLYELGASAGLNLLLDRYRYRLGATEAGDPASPHLLAPDWAGPSPPSAPIRIAGRRGVDLSPLDGVRDRERLTAYVWPDQSERLAQLEAALDLAADGPAPVDAGDAAEWLELELATAPEDGVLRVVMHSIAYQYFPPDRQARIARRIAAAGALARPDAPLAWLRMEKLPEEDSPSLRLTCYPDGRERLLAFCHPHGRAVRWLSGA
jgi:hypothetical protein